MGYDNKILSLIVAILPVYLIGLYIYTKDKDKESRKLLTKLFIFGIVSCIPAAILELIIGYFFGPQENMSLLTLALYVIFSIAGVEEICKWFFVYKIAYHDKEFDHIYDSLVYCVFVSLGFAILENILYVFQGSFATSIIRAVSAIPGHTCYAIIMGNYLGLAKIADINGNKELFKKNKILSIIFPILLHSLYDYCLYTENIFFFCLFILLIIFIYIYSVLKVKKLSNVKYSFSDNMPLDNFIKKSIANIDNNNIKGIVKDDKNSIFMTYNDYDIWKEHDTVNYCPNCGVVAYGNFCANCGHKLSLNKINDGNNLTH